MTLQIPNPQFGVDTFDAIYGICFNEKSEWIVHADQYAADEAHYGKQGAKTCTFRMSIFLIFYRPTARSRQLLVTSTSLTKKSP